jgi:Protein kinase domain
MQRHALSWRRVITSGTIETEGTSEPVRLVDTLLGVALRTGADAIYLEPVPTDAETYEIAFERASALLATVTVDARLGAAAIARLAFIGGLDLSAGSPATAIVPIRAGEREGDAVITMRPGGTLRADVMVVGRKRPQVGGTRVYRNPNIGETVSRYRVLQRLGEGGMGTVFRVEHVTLGRTYALKILIAAVIEHDPSAAQKFLHEARTAARIRHPNIVDVFDFGHLDDGRPYLVMELLEGESLADRVDRGPLPPLEVITIARQLASALGAAHERGVIHADVTPANAFATGPAGLHIKLLDFGLSELAGAELDGEKLDFVLGTPSYISPEQLRGLRPTERSDQYGLGAVLFELLTGAPPYVDPDLRGLCLKHLNAPIPEATSPHGPLPPRLAGLITTCLQKTPQARFPNMATLIAVLDDIERVTERTGWRRWLNS